MTVDVYIEHTRERPQEFQDAKDDVVDVAEARRCSFLRVVKTTCPVYCDVRRAVPQPVCAGY